MLKDVGDVGLTTAAMVLEALRLGPLDMALIWRDSLGLFGGFWLADILSLEGNQNEANGEKATLCSQVVDDTRGRLALKLSRRKL